MNFINVKAREYYRGGYVSTGMFVALDDIARVVECTDDYKCTNIITRDGKIHTLNERYDDVIAKIKSAEGEKETDHED